MEAMKGVRTREKMGSLPFIEGGFSKKVLRHQTKGLERQASVQMRETEAGTGQGLFRECYHSMGTMVSFLNKDLVILWDRRFYEIWGDMQAIGRQCSEGHQGPSFPSFHEASSRSPHNSRSRFGRNNFVTVFFESKG